MASAVRAGGWSYDSPPFQRLGRSVLRQTFYWVMADGNEARISEQRGY